MKNILKDKKKRKWIFIAAAVVVAFAALLYLFADKLGYLFTHIDNLRDLIARAGVFAPIVFFVLQVVQIVVAPIPGNVTTAVGGVLFGWWALPLTVVGSLAGFAIVVLISRKFGRPLIEKIFGKDQVKKFDFLIDSKAEFILFIIFLLPALPDDLVGYLAGLTGVRFRTLMILSLVGRLPTQAATILFGDQLAAGDYSSLVIMIIIIAALALVIFIFRKWFMELLKAKDRKKFLRATWKKIKRKFRRK
jgi:uncharacterized membrane protein YdjX (TVP38/TMEM64 family)